MRRFELVEGSSSKFWQVTVEDADVVVVFGRIGAKGQTKRSAFASAAEAQKARDALVLEKTRKGYRELTGASPVKEAAKTPPTKRATKAAPEGEPTRWPRRPTPGEAVRCFRESDAALFSRGFPQMHVLLDEATKPEAAITSARKALDAIDPRLPVEVPREIGRRFVAGYLTHRTWGHGPRAETYEVPAHVAAREAALRSDRAIDASTLEAFLRAHCPSGGQWRVELDGVPVAGTDNETYGWRLHELVHLHEAVLGTASVAATLVEHLLRALRDPEAWGFWGGDPHRHNASAHHLAFALGSMRRRMEPAEWTALVAPFRDAASERLLVFADLLACLADDARTAICPYYGLDLAILRRDRPAIAALVSGKDVLFWRPEATWLLGGAPYVGVVLGNVRRLPDWKQVRFVDEVGRIAIPEVAVAIAMLASSRSGKRAASEWLLAHADFARPILLDAAASLPGETDRERMREALATLGEGAPVDAAPLSEEELGRELDALFLGLEPALVACGGDEAEELAVMRRTFDRYCEARAAAGEVIPEAYFGHQLVDWRPADAAAGERWFALAMQVQDDA